MMSLPLQNARHVPQIAVNEQATFVLLCGDFISMHRIKHFFFPGRDKDQDTLGVP